MNRTYEQENAIKEGHRNKAEDDYFNPRPGFLEHGKYFRDGFDRGWDAAKADAPAARDVMLEAPVTVLPDGSAFFTGSFPLPKDHWLYAPRCSEWDSVRDTTADTPHPILTHEARTSVVAAVRYAVRGATMCGAEKDFDPDAIVQNAVYALCGPDGDSTAALNAPPADRDAMRQAVTEEMAAAYLTASNRYWRETDKWRNGTALEATRVSLEAALAAAPTPPAEQQDSLNDAEVIDLIGQRDHREEIIDQLCDAVLGPDRAEWSSAYYFEDAVSEVQERIAELETRKECRESNAAAEQGEQEPAAFSIAVPGRNNFLVFAPLADFYAGEMFSKRISVTPLYTHPAPSLATLRAEVEGLHNTIEYSDHTWCCVADVLALIDKMGGKV